MKKSRSKKGTNGEAGTGLGLVLVNELVKLNKGAIQVKKSITRRNDF
ncbi:MAG: hypothetical protein HC912_02625 [Saprospiraceae bacterium]|nr:hypothetical protein [Saprospiraceae bacterium]